MSRSPSLRFAVLLLIALTFTPSVAIAACAGDVCVSDESSGDTSSACEDGVPHAPRYRYYNVTASEGERDVAASLTFACMSNGLRRDQAYANVTHTDSSRTDGARLYFAYGSGYATPCYVMGLAHVDRVLIRDFGTAFDRDIDCPHVRSYPSLVSLLP